MPRWFRRLLVAVCCLTLSAPVMNAEESPGKLIVHEWGTFTTFSGSNGVHLDFRPLQDNDLPLFVFNRASQSGMIWFGKGRLKTRVRMETPVTYFYTDQARTVKAAVEFPKGLLTEFYPPVRQLAPAFRESLAMGLEGEPIGNSRLDWGEIDLLPLSALQPRIDDPVIAERIARHVDATLPPDATGNHYAAARETDSALVHVRLPDRDSESGKKLASSRGDFFEKFLFYRGVGKFDVPVNVTNPQAGQFVVTNTGTEALPRLLILQVQAQQLKYSFTPDVAAGQSIALPAPESEVSLADLQNLMTTELTKTGLYEKEARAMVKTWSSSWFSEEGLRLFYLVPQSVTDTVLPLKISPQPDEQVRVMVGRVEIMSTSQEQQILKLVTQSAKERLRLQTEAQEQQTQAKMPAIPDELIQMGRFAEPALARIREISNDSQIKSEADTLIWQLKSKKTNNATAAEKAL